MRLFSTKDRPFHLGPYPLERLTRTTAPADLTNIPPMTPLTRPDDPVSLINAMRDYQAMLDTIRDGVVKREKAEIPDNLTERSHNLKSFGYYCDASQVGVCELPKAAILDTPIINPDITRLGEILTTGQTNTLASGVDGIMAELKETIAAPPSRIDHHSHAIVYLYEFPRDPGQKEAGTEWIQDSQSPRAALRAAETVTVLANYLRLLGYEARAHTHSSSDVNLYALAVAAGLGIVEQDDNYITTPYLGRRFGIGAITTTLKFEPDLPLARQNILNRLNSHGPAWWLGVGTAKNAFNRQLFKNRAFKDSIMPFERSKRQDQPTTFIDEQRVARVPKRADMFARALFGDMGKATQEAAKNGNYVRKNPTSFAPRQALGAFILIQNGTAAPEINNTARDPARNANNIKAALYFLGADAVGISRCPDWAYYSHDAALLDDFSHVDWANRVHLHFSDEGSRADLDRILSSVTADHHVYVCGPARFMTAVVAAGAKAGYPEDTLHREYFSVPEAPDTINYDFTLRLARSGKQIFVPADKTAPEALAEAGVHVDVKCSDGLCGVCACGLLDGEVEHRDFVLGNKDRQQKIILCSSRAAQEHGTITIDL